MKTGVLKVWDGSQWKLVTGIKGDTGPQGESGPQGEPGLPGLDAGYVWNGSNYVAQPIRIFVGPIDPSTAGFTMSDGDIWENTS